jgi:uncharacterized protein DUF4129
VPSDPVRAPVADGGRGFRRLPVVTALAGAALVAVLVLLGVATRAGSYARALPADPAAATTAPYSPHPMTFPAGVTAGPTTTAAPEPVDPVTGWVVLVLVLLLAAAVLGVLVRIAWQHLAGPRLHRPLQRPVSGGDVSAQQIPVAVERALRTIDQPDAGEAVVQAWLLLGAAAAAAGTPARTSETATEYADRLAGVHRLPVESVHRLAELYLEARFSGHEVGAGQRNAARTELHRLRSALAGAGRAARAGTADGTGTAAAVR